MTRTCLAAVLTAASMAFVGCAEKQSQFASKGIAGQWPQDITRTWVGPDFWANRLQDWRIADGRLECLEARPEKPMRTVHALICRLSDGQGDLHTSVKTGLIQAGCDVVADAAVGFLIGAGPKLDYRAAALIHHTPNTDGGLFAGIRPDGTLFISDFSRNDTPIGKSLAQSERTNPVPAELRLTLLITPQEGTYTIRLDAHDAAEDQQFDTLILEDVAPELLIGGVALVSHPGSNANTARFWFENWTLGGSKLEHHPDRNSGPILSAQHTLSRGTLKLTAQMMPVGENDNQTVSLQIKKNDKWSTVATADIIVPGYTATFKVAGWDDTKDTPYRLSYLLKLRGGHTREYTYDGAIRHNPVEKSVITVAGFTGNHNVKHPGIERGIPWTPAGMWFPHNDVVANVAKQQPDILFFSGDQVYEGDSPTRPEPFPAETGRLDYLYKWYLWCWAFRDLTRDIPAVSIPDDHDIFQGNLFGCSGRLAPNSWHDGGYKWPAENVNMVDRTQTSNLPDPYDPTPVQRGIGVYYCAMNYGGISFAIIEDRKFKGDYNLVPGTVIEDAHIMTQYYSVENADVPGVPLLGDRQIEFLEHWTADWSNYAMLKVLLSQTIFCNLQTRDYYHDKLDRDLDSNGWPQTGRNRALRVLRKGFAFHLAGDQHLASIIHHGADDWDDAIWSLCVPSVANFYPRSWLPPGPGGNHQPGMPDYTGRYKDGLGNHITVWAAANPDGPTRHQPADLHDKMPGYGIVRLNKPEQTITMECWPRYADPTDPSTGSQYRGWPKTISMLSNYGRKPAGHLSKIHVEGAQNPVLQVIDEESGEIVYTLRIAANEFTPPVFTEHAHTVVVRDPDAGRSKKISGLNARQSATTIEVSL